MIIPKIQVFFDNKEIEAICPLIKIGEIEKALIPFIERKEGPDKINLVLVNNDFIQKLNSKFRNINQATDVLSFNYGKNENQGEVYVSAQYLKNNVSKLKTPLSFLVNQAIVHGMLHLFGYDHQNEKEEKIMKVAERKILERLGD
jgi:probable rRNA maturation factor